MANPTWFDYEFYMGAKLVQMQKADPAGDWNMSKLVDAFAQNGFVDEDGAYDHFTQFGAAEEVAPNADFNASEYYAAKAAQFYGVEPSAVTELQIANVKAIINQAGMNAWTHYQQFGSNEGVNPSNAFDADAYLAAKATAMGDGWTAEKVAEAIKGNGMTVLEHYLTYAGKGEGEVAEGVTFPVPDDQKVPASNPGETFNLTAGRDVFTGTDGNDIFNANLLMNPSSGTVNTASFNVTDELDGGKGNDTLNVELTGSFTDANLGSVKNIENVNFTIDNTATADLSTWTGLEHLNVNQLGTAAVQGWTVSGAKTVSVKGGSTVTVTDSAATGDDTLVTVSAEGATGLVTVSSDALTTLNLTGVGSGATVTAAAGERALTVNMNNVTGTVADATATTLNVNATGAASTGVTLTADAATAVNINADEALTLTAVNAAAATGLTIKGDSLVTISALTANELTTISAAESTGGVIITPMLGTNVAFTGSSAADAITLGGSTKATDMGAGNDKVTLSAAIAAAGSLKMGEGDDTVTVDVLQTTTKAGAIDGGAGDNDKLIFTDTTYVADLAHGAVFTGFEVLEVSASAADKVFDTSLIAGIKSYGVGASSANVTLSNILNNATTTVTGNVADQKSLTVALAVDTQNDTHTVVFDNGSSTATAGVELGGSGGGGLTVNLIEHLNFVSDGNANSPNKIASLNADADLKDITITGDQDFTIAKLANAVTTELTINGSAATGKLTIDASIAGSTAAININGGSAADTITGGVHGGVINGGAGADTINLAVAGAKDILLYTQANDSTQSNMDSVTNFTHGEDKINIAALSLAKQAVVSASSVDLTSATLFATAGVVFDTNTHIAYIDANNDGVFTADGDMAISLTGASIDANDFIFA